MNLRNPFVRFALWMAGISQTTASQVQAAIPNIQSLIRLAKEAESTIDKVDAWYKKAAPLIDEGQVLVKEAQPYLKRAVPMIEKAQDDWKDVEPAFSALLDSMHQQQLAGVKRDVAATNIAATLTGKYGAVKRDVGPATTPRS